MSPGEVLGQDVARVVLRDVHAMQLQGGRRVAVRYLKQSEGHDVCDRANGIGERRHDRYWPEAIVHDDRLLHH